MAMRTLYELRRVTNDLIESGRIDEDTRIVVEVAREMNDSNKRWAIEKFQRDRERENDSYAYAISQLINETNFSGQANSMSYKDKQKFRLWTEQLEDIDKVEQEISSIEEDKKLTISEEDIRT